MTDQEKCIFCDLTTDDMPLIKMKYKGDVAWICAQHMPVIIHNTTKLQDIFPDVNLPEKLEHQQ